MDWLLSCVSLFCLLAVCRCAFDDELLNSLNIFVHSSTGSDGPQCLNNSAVSLPLNPCRTLSYALEHLQNATRVVLLRSTVDYPLDNGLVVVDNKHIFALEGESGFVATIRCSNQSGFVFSEIEYLSLVNLHVTGCGTIQSSTSKNYTDGATSTTSFLVAVYMNWCAKVNISRLSVTKSEGTAVTMYNCGSQNAVVTDSLFAFNQGDSSPNYGGGVYFEFTYCDPGVKQCDNSSNSNNLIVFDNCSFICNQATAESGNTSYIVPHGDNHTAFGRGGGLSFYFKGTAQNNTVKISNSRFVNNTAVWGGGLFVEFDDSAVNNCFTVEFSHFEKNTCNYTSKKGTGGGGMRVGHYVFTQQKDLLPGNKITVESCNFTQNSAMHGGGLSVSPSLIEAYNPETIPQVIVSNCHFYENTAKLGAALESTVFPLFLDGSTIKLSIVNSSFVNNEVKYVDSIYYQLGIGAVYLNGVPAEFNSTVNFTGNVGSALAVVTCYIDFTNCWKATFCGNQGKDGGAINLLGNSVIQIGQDTDMLFENNHANLRGGAIHNTYVGYENTVSYTKCFIKHSDNSIPFADWTSKLSFINNTASLRGKAIFSSSVLPCSWVGNYGLVSDVSSFFCQWHFETKDGSSCADQIDTLTNSMASETNWQTAAYPGEMIHLNITVRDDLGHLMSNTVVFNAEIFNKSQVQVSPPFRFVTNQSVVLTGEPINDTVIMKLDTVFSRDWHIKYSVNVLECPTGYKPMYDMEYGGDICKCSLNNNSFGNHLRCADGQSHSVFIDNGYWIGVLEKDGHGPFYMGNCPPRYCKVSKNGNGNELENGYKLQSAFSQELDNEICSQANRTGVLCGQCIGNFSVSVNTIDYICVNCSDASLLGLNLTLYLLGNYVPVVVLFLVIIAFNIRLTTGPAVSFIFFCQIVGFGNGITELIVATKANIPSFLDYLYKIPFNVLNLSFLFLQLLDYHICFRGLNALDVTQLNALVALTPLLMIFIVIVAVKLKETCYSRAVSYRIVTLCRGKCSCLLKQERNLKTSLLHAFAAFILLSYNNFCVSASELLEQLGLFNESGAYYPRYVSYHAGHIFTDSAYFQFRYALSAYLMLLIFVFPPLVLLLWFPVHLFERCIVSQATCIRKYYPADKMAIFLDTFQGCYRDKMRFFAGLYLLCRVAIFLTASQSVNLYNEYSIQAVMCLALLVLIAIFQPYQQKHLNIVDILILADLVIIQVIRAYLIYSGKNSESWVYWVCYVLIFLPVLYMAIYVAYILIGTKRMKQLTKCFKFRQQNSEHQTLFDVVDQSLSLSDNDNEVEQLLRRAEERNDYYPALIEHSKETNRDAWR